MNRLRTISYIASAFVIAFVSGVSKFLAKQNNIECVCRLPD